MTMLPWQRFYSVKMAFRFENVTDNIQIIGCGFFDTQNNQGLGMGCQPEAKG